MFLHDIVFNSLQVFIKQAKRYMGVDVKLFWRKYIRMTRQY